MAKEQEFRISVPLRKVFPQHCLSLGLRQHWGKGEIIPLPQPPSAGFYMVISGQVRLFGSTANGERKVLFVAEQGCLLYDAYFFCSLPPMSTAEVFHPAETVFWSGSTIERLLNEDRLFQATVLYSIANRSVNLGVDLVDACHTRPDLYLLNVLRAMAMREGFSMAEPWEVKTHQDDLAELLGVHRVTVNRWLKKLERDNVLSVGRGRIVLHKVALNSKKNTPV